MYRKLALPSLLTQRDSQLKQWSVVKRHRLVAQFPWFIASDWLFVKRGRIYIMFSKLALFIEKDSIVSSQLNWSNVSPSQSRCRRPGPCGLEPPVPGAVTRKSNKLREGSFAAGSQREVLIVLTATCRLKFRENCKPPAARHCWVSDDCVCFFTDTLYVHLCEGGQCIVAGFSMYEDGSPTGGGSHTFSKLKACTLSVVPVREVSPSERGRRPTKAITRIFAAFRPPEIEFALWKLLTCQVTAGHVILPAPLF